MDLSICVQRSYWNRFWYCSGPEQRQFGPVAEHFFVPEVEHAKHLLCSLFTYVVAVSGGWLQPGLKVREAREVEAQPNSS